MRRRNVQRPVCSPSQPAVRQRLEPPPEPLRKSLRGSGRGRSRQGLWRGRHDKFQRLRRFAGAVLHRCDYYLKVLEGYGIKVEDRLCELRLKQEDMTALDSKLSRAGVLSDEKYVVLNTGGNWDL